jgi:hypothetical protein
MTLNFKEALAPGGQAKATLKILKTGNGALRFRGQLLD